MLVRTKSGKKRDGLAVPHTSLPMSMALSTISARSNMVSRRHGFSGGHGFAARTRPSVIFSCQRLSVTVGGCAAFYSAVLSCAPENTVTISPGNMPTCIRISPSLQIFTKENWMKPQFFRVAAVGGTYEDNSKDDRKLQIVEHFSSSIDTRFNGNRVLYIPSTILIQISGREGSNVFTTGLALGTARVFGKAAAKINHQLTHVDVEPAQHPPGELVAKSSMVMHTPSAAAAAAVAAIEAANSATHAALSRRTSRRNIFATAAITDSDGLYSIPKDANGIIKVSCRKNQTVFLYKSGRMVVLGKMDVDYSATKEEDQSVVHADVALSKMLVDIDCGADHIVAVTEQGYLLTWGEGKDGRLGHGDSLPVRQPRLIRSLQHKRIVHIACGARHTFALAEDGDVFSWGYGEAGALGHGLSAHEQVFESVTMPMEVLTLKNRGVAKVSCGDMHTAVVLLNGKLLTCGWGDNGRLGRPCSSDYSSYFEAVDLKNHLCTFVACGGAHTVVLTETKAVYTFGSNSYGQLGLGDCKDRLSPAEVLYFRDDRMIVTSVATGKYNSCATTQDGRLFAWGSDELGQCGIGTYPQIYTVPHLVASAVGLGVNQVSSGDSHSVALTTASQKHLDALEANHPTRYLTLVERYEAFVKEDQQKRDQVLAQAKRRQEEYDAAMRKRKPPLGRKLLAKKVGMQCNVDNQLKEIDAAEVASISSPTVVVASRPQTARPTQSPPPTSMSPRRLARNTRSAPPQRVRCSSATLWRQSRLVTLQHEPEAAFYPDVSSRHLHKRPATVVQQPNFSSQGRKALGALLRGELSASSSSSSLKDDETSPPESVTLFAASRPKSAPSRPMQRAREA
ncbi:TPA: hypothetical protein N0F65_004776 [Lagenidium giganteum]|uniref:Regulator of chromosome condensation n=1 Tax=Lagenidium giganteum TaxID=4803 RepID=A0AAV2Z454_9STRA|nr:TPA: hypothetical protein N0F65_004776 [Lagenidium giganteum]